MNVTSAGACLARLTRHVRRQVAQLQKPAPTGEAAACGPRGANVQDLGEAIAVRVAAIDPFDPDRPRKAFRAFLESVFIAEFGADLINDAGFHQLVERIHREMERDPALAKLIDQASAALLAA